MEQIIIKNVWYSYLQLKNMYSYNIYSLLEMLPHNLLQHLRIK